MRLARTLDIVTPPGRGARRPRRGAARRARAVVSGSCRPRDSCRPCAPSGSTVGSLLGNERIRDSDDWPLSVPLPEADGEGWDQARTWVLVAGGDAFTDRGVYDTVVRKGRGVDFPFDGGTARVTGHVCCDPVFGDNLVPRYVLTGDQGAVRRLFRDAELAIANHEMPTTEAWDFHSSGLRFSGRPDLTRIFTRAGIDWLSLANNHIKDYGTEGIARHAAHPAPARASRFGGAGVDLEQARRVSYLDGGRARRWPSSPASASRRRPGPVRGRVAARPASTATSCPTSRPPVAAADLVIVVPALGRGVHAPAAAVHAQARRALGEGRGRSHPRRPQPCRRGHRGHRRQSRPLLAGQPHLRPAAGRPTRWSQRSSKLPSTAVGWWRCSCIPTSSTHTSQPNLLDAASGEGRRLLRQMRAASAAWLDW